MRKTVSGPEDPKLLQMPARAPDGRWAVVFSSLPPADRIPGCDGTSLAVTQMFVAADALISDPIKLADWSQNARAHMELNFRLQKEADALIAVYRQLLSN